VTVVVQVNGKLRDRIEAPAGLSEAELVAIARERPRVAAAIEAVGGGNGARVLREVVVPDRLVNLVVG
jgi:leucyl-tRNA synthetase